jgi:mannose-6-phosphate isomerase-like protein (cupin superfamily)
MSTAIQSIGLDEGFGPGAAAEGRAGGSWKRTIWSDEGRSNTIVAVWKAEPGTYVFPPRALEETFIVAEGEALCSLGGKPPERIGVGSIVRVREGEAITLEILTPFRKLATVVPRNS